MAGKPSSLMAKLRARPDTREAGPLAGWIIKHMKAGTLKKAAKEASAKRKPSKGKNRDKKQEELKFPKPISKDLDDPFNESWGDEDEGSPEDAELAKYEAKQVADLEKAERSRLHGIVMEAGGLKTRDDLREEYAGISNTFKRRDGMDGDEMADYFATYYPEFGIEDERDLIDFLAS